MNDLLIRPADEDDLDAINDIYNYYVLNSTATFQCDLETPARRRCWFDSHDELHPITVAEVERHVVGWAALSAFHHRDGYQHTTEDSVYVHHEWGGRGIGSALLTDLIECAAALGQHTIIAAISADQNASRRLHERLGFAEVGRLNQVAYKFDSWFDLVYLQLILID